MSHKLNQHPRYWKFDKLYVIRTGHFLLFSIDIFTLQAIVEQLTYGPAALICFFFGMNLLQNKSFQEAKQEVELKLLPTWKVCCYFCLTISFITCFLLGRNLFLAYSANLQLFVCRGTEPGDLRQYLQLCVVGLSVLHAPSSGKTKTATWGRFTLRTFRKLLTKVIYLFIARFLSFSKFSTYFLVRSIK